MDPGIEPALDDRAHAGLPGRDPGRRARGASARPERGADRVRADGRLIAADRLPRPGRRLPALVARRGGLDPRRGHTARGGLGPTAERLAHEPGGRDGLQLALPMDNREHVDRDLPLRQLAARGDRRLADPGRRVGDRRAILVRLAALAAFFAASLGAGATPAPAIDGAMHAWVRDDVAITARAYDRALVGAKGLHAAVTRFL